jgi:putative phosphoesterase
MIYSRDLVAMRIAVLSDIHGNLTALEAVLADLSQTSPDLVFHGGDLADFGSSPAGVLDCVIDRGWAGVMGNTDQMLVEPASLEQFADASPAPRALWDTLRAIAVATRQSLGGERLAWLANLPIVFHHETFALVHASPQTCWRAPAESASDAELELEYGSLGKSIVIFGHVHRPSIRAIAGEPKLLINTGSVGLSYDGDPRASYLILDDGVPTLRRVAYDIDQELKALAACGRPGAEWTSRMLKTSSLQMP